MEYVVEELNDHFRSKIDRVDGNDILLKIQPITEDDGNFCSKICKCSSQSEYGNFPWFYDKNGLFL